MKYLIVTSMRNEAPYILEWIAYHQAIGVDHFLVYSNDCDDGTDILLDRLHDRGIVTHVRNDKIGKQGIQWTALNRATKHPLVSGADWILFSDVDEFVNIKCGDGTLDDLLAAAPQADAFALTWRLFGNSGVIDITDRPVIEQFTQCAPFPCMSPPLASQVKTLFRNTGFYGKLGVHRPKQPRQQGRDKVVWVNGSGRRLGQEWVTQAQITYGPVGGMDLVALNHYSVKSAMSFLTKSQRGLPNRSHKKIDIGYWADRNFNEVSDRSIQRKLPQVIDGIAEFRKDPEIDSLHKAGLAWHRKQAVAVMNTLEGIRLLTRILGVSRQDVDPKLAGALLRTRVQVAQRMKKSGQ